MVEFPFELGDIVAYRAAFLRSILDYTYASASKRGAVTAIIPIARGVSLVTVGGDFGGCRILSTNLILASRIHLEPN
jgi:hypothetical protein